MKIINFLLNTIDFIINFVGILTIFCSIVIYLDHLKLKQLDKKRKEKDG